MWNIYPWNRFETQCTELEHRLYQFRDGLNENVFKGAYTHRLMSEWGSSDAYLPEAFVISQDGDFGTINNLHLGTSSIHPVRILFNHYTS